MLLWPEISSQISHPGSAHPTLPFPYARLGKAPGCPRWLLGEGNKTRQLLNIGICLMAWGLKSCGSSHQMCLEKSWGRVSITHFLWTKSDLFSAGVMSSETEAGRWRDLCQVTEHVGGTARMGTGTSELPSTPSRQLGPELSEARRGSACAGLTWWYKKGNFLLLSKPEVPPSSYSLL